MSSYLFRSIPACAALCFLAFCIPYASGRTKLGGDNAASFFSEFWVNAVLERLVYRSKATHQLGSLHLFNLLNACREKNQRLDITGHLLYTNEVFVQCIEGPPASIESLWCSLQRDERHYDIELISRGPLQSRRFGDWSMAFSSYAHFNKFQISGFFPVEDNGMNEAALRCAAR